MSATTRKSANKTQARPGQDVVAASSPAATLHCRRLAQRQLAESAMALKEWSTRAEAFLDEEMDLAAQEEAAMRYDIGAEMGEWR